jgi:uracil-DNA glycosylase family 4
MPRSSLPLLARQIIACRRCERLRDYCTDVGVAKRRAYMDWDYWTRPVPGFGDPNAWLWIVGLAPAAHGANRTGRVFTGDRSGDFLFAALHRAGIANQPTSVRRDDGLSLQGCFISPAVRCAPPANKPSPEEVLNCAEYLDEEWRLLKKKRVLLALGKIAWDACLSLAKRNLGTAPRDDFGHGAQLRLAENLHLVGSYHVSQQNTFTGKLTTKMFDEVLAVCRSRIV